MPREQIDPLLAGRTPEADMTVTRTPMAVMDILPMSLWTDEEAQPSVFGMLVRRLNEEAEKRCMMIPPNSKTIVTIKYSRVEETGLVDCRAEDAEFVQVVALTMATY